MGRGGRRDRPIDRQSGPPAGFVDDLRRLRGEMSLQEVGSRMGYHSSTVSRRLKPDELPPLDFVRAYVIACGADPGPWEERWRKISPLDVPPPRRRKRWLVIGAAAAAAILAATLIWLYGSASPAASTPATSPAPPKSGFSWKITRMVSGLTSRTWSQPVEGSIEIWANLACPGPAIPYWIALKPDGETVRFPCGSWQHHRWEGVSAGKHTFEVWKEGDGRALSGEGVLGSSTPIIELPKAPPT